jgi:hypothetical protein
VPLQQRAGGDDLVGGLMLRSPVSSAPVSVVAEGCFARLDAAGLMIRAARHEQWARRCRLGRSGLSDVACRVLSDADVGTIVCQQADERSRAAAEYAKLG